MKNLLLLFSLLFLVSCATVENESGEPESQKTPPVEPAKPEPVFQPSFIVPEVNGSYYYQVLELLKTEQPDVLPAIDFVKFRYAYLKVRDRDRLAMPTELREQLRQSMEAGNNEQALKLCEEIQRYDFTDIYSHVMRNYFLDVLEKDSSFYKDYVNRLLRSIFESGDGRTPETAFHVIQIKEEYEILKFMGLTPHEQTTYDTGGHSFDVITCENRNGEWVRIFFDITEHMEMLNRAFSNR